MEVKHHKCLACNAELKFDPKSQKWICEYCASSYTLQNLKDARIENKNNNDISLFNGYHCPDCGAEIIMDENTSVTECVYCGNTSIITERLEGKFKPKEIIPFKTTKEDAINTFMKYKKGKWFMAKEFIQKSNINKISGIYIPFYLYDLSTSASIYLETTNTYNWSDNFYNYTRTEHYNVLRSGEMSFKRIPTDASKKFPDDIMDSIEPYDYKDLVEFDYSYISGFLSEKYDLTTEYLTKRAEKRANESAIQILLNRVTGYDTRKIKKTTQKSILNSSKYVLLPVWMLNIKYKNKIYTLAMNGQTGKFTGNVPISWKRIIKYWLIFFLVITVITILINLFS